GLLIPLVLQFIWDSVERTMDLRSQVVLEKLTLIIWPTSIATLAASPDPSVERGLFVGSVVLNVVLYGVLGIFAYLGLRKHRLFFVPPSLLLLVVWWRLLGR